MWNAPHASAARPSPTSCGLMSTTRAISAPYSLARTGTPAMSSSSYWPRSAVWVQGIPPLSRIQATATEVSRPPEKAMPMRSPFGMEVKTLLTGHAPWSEFAQLRDEFGSGDGLTGHHQEGVVACDGADDVVQC